MKSLIAYYSYSGNTKKVASVLAGYLRQGWEVEILKLKGLDESDKFFTQCARAFRHKKGKIQEVDFNLSGYDLICFGTPVWAFGPAPAVNTYLDRCLGLQNKEVILFVTYGGGAGVDRCLNYMQNILSKKGAKKFSRFAIQQFKVDNQDFVLSKIKEMTRL